MGMFSNFFGGKPKKKKKQIKYEFDDEGEMYEVGGKNDPKVKSAPQKPSAPLKKRDNVGGNMRKIFERRNARIAEIFGEEKSSVRKKLGK